VFSAPPPAWFSKIQSVRMRAGRSQNQMCRWPLAIVYIHVRLKGIPDGAGSRSICREFLSLRKSRSTAKVNDPCGQSSALRFIMWHRGLSTCLSIQQCKVPSRLYPILTSHATAQASSLLKDAYFLRLTPLRYFAA